MARPVRGASLVVGVALVGALAAGCGGGDTSSANGDPPPGTRAAAATQTAQRASCQAAGLHTVEGGLLRMPSGARPGRTPLLLVVIPGGDGDSDDRLGIGAAGNRQGFAILYA